MRLLMISIFLLGSLNAIAQLTPDDGLADFVKTRNYVQLTDTAHLPKSIIPYLHLIENDLSAQKYAGLADIYVNLAYVWDNNYQLTVTVVNLNGIKTLKHEYDNRPKERDTVINGSFEKLEFTILGNPAGERKLVINKDDGKISTYISQ